MVLRRLAALVLLAVGMCVGFVWVFVAVIPVFIARGMEAAEREVERGYYLCAVAGRLARA
jgi:hypothetical protein